MEKEGIGLAPYFSGNSLKSKEALESYLEEVQATGNEELISEAKSLIKAIETEKGKLGEYLGLTFS